MPEGKRPARSIIENVRYQHSHEVDGQEINNIVRNNDAVKPRSNERITQNGNGFVNGH